MQIFVNGIIDINKKAEIIHTNDFSFLNPIKKPGWQINRSDLTRFDVCYRYLQQPLLSLHLWRAKKPDEGYRHYTLTDHNAVEVDY